MLAHPRHLEEGGGGLADRRDPTTRIICSSDPSEVPTPKPDTPKRPLHEMADKETIQLTDEAVVV